MILDPAPEEWITEDRLLRLKAEIVDAIPLLLRSGVLEKVVSTWILTELGETDSDCSPSFEWARRQWGHRLDSLFLQKKDQLDQVSCRLLRVNHQGLALELYHRLLAKEASFEELSNQFGMGKERFNGGLLTLQPLSGFPGRLGEVIRKLQPGELTKPLRMGERFGVVQVESLVPAVHGEESEELLLKQELQQWIKAMAEHLASLVSSTH